MKAPLRYLLLHRLKNMALGLVRSPAKLLYTLVMLALLVMVVFTGNAGGVPDGGYMDLRVLIGGCSALYGLMFYLTAKSGFQTGASLFSMADVNFLFAGPFRSQKVLFYGLFQQLGTSMLVALFLLFQYSWLHNLFGLGVGALVLILVGYGLAVFLGQFGAMMLYLLLSLRPGLRRGVQVVFWAIPAAWCAWLVLVGLGNRADLWNALGAAACTLPGRLLPVGGWLGSAVGGVLLGRWDFLVFGLGLSLVLFAALLAWFTRTEPDFYEDVLQSTETAYQVKAEAKAGRITEGAGRKVKTGKTGLGGGMGASAFYYKHKLEMRRSGTFFLSGTAIVFALIPSVFALFVREGGVLPAFGFAVYMQLFSVGTNRVILELTKPYAYLVPEPPFRKMLWCLRASVSAFGADALLLAVPLGLIVGASPEEIVLLFLCRISFSLLFTGGNMLEDRIFGGVTNRGLTMLFYFVVLLLLSAPGLVLAVVFAVSGILPMSGTAVALLAMTVCNVPMALLALFLARGIFAQAELNR
jgi:hypothetical protein